MSDKNHYSIEVAETKQTYTKPRVVVLGIAGETASATQGVGSDSTGSYSPVS